MSTRVVVLASGSGTNLQSLLDAERSTKGLGGSVVRLITDRPGVGALERAAAAGVPARTVLVQDHPDREAWSRALAVEMARAAPDLVVLAGFMRILPGTVVDRWPMLNVHPSLLPAFPGGHAVEDALAWGVKVTGCTVHFVEEQVDHGPIVAQEAVTIQPDDTRETLHARIQAVEHRLLPECVRLFCTGGLIVADRSVRIRQPSAPATPKDSQPPKDS